MLRYIILFVTVFCMVQSQRPWHAGTGNRLPQVLPQYIDERMAVEQAGQTGQTTPVAQGNQIIPTAQGTPVDQGAQEIPVGQRVQGIPVSQGTQGIPVCQGPQGTPTYQGTQGTPTYQGTQGTPTYQGTQGTPTYQGPQRTPTYQKPQGIPTYQGAQGNLAGQETQRTPIIGTGSTLLGNRIDSGEGGSAAAPTLSTTINPADLPIDAHGDIDLVNRIKTWPRDKQPFWYINWQAIQNHRGDANNTAQPAQTQLNSRSFFAG